jgi:hypothetical protein
MVRSTEKERVVEATARGVQQGVKVQQAPGGQ